MALRCSRHIHHRQLLPPAKAPWDSLDARLLCPFFLVRPLGGLFWGPLGDRMGRKRVLALTIIVMAASTFAIGLLPTHALVGWLASALLILLRMIQVFSTGGEYGGAADFMAEYAPDKKRGFYGIFL